MYSSSPCHADTLVFPQPLSQILNLPLIYSSPHTTSQISSLWQAYHSAHPTLAPTFLSASIPPGTYASMVKLAKQHPVFLLPLPREQEGGKVGGGEASWEMFFLQWTFHPTPSVNHEDVDSTGRTREVERQPASSVMFTSLEEYKQKGEWARPWLVLTHYPDLHNNPLGHSAPPEPNVDAKGKAEVVIDPTAPPQAHPVVLMRGEISPSSTKSPVSSPLPSTDLALTQAEAQLLALGLQRFYCSTVQVGRESDEARREREEREALLRGFGKEGWDWNALVRLAFGGMV